MTSHLAFPPIRTGIIGLGRAGVNIHLAALKQHPRFKVTALCDPLEGRAEQVAATLEEGAVAFTTSGALLASGQCDLVVIASPSHRHLGDAKAALESGHDCLLEKPMASTGAGAKELVALADSLGRRLFVHHQYVLSHELLFLQEVIASRILGDIFHIELFWTSYSRRWDWQTLRKNHGGQLLNTCPHMVSLLLPLLGGDLRVEAADVRLVKDAGDTEDHVRCFFRGSNGVTAAATVSSVCALPLPRLTLFGSHGTLQEDYFNATLRYYDPAAAPVRQAIDAAAPMDGSLVEELPWKEVRRPVCPERPAGSFHDHVAAVLCGETPLRVDPAEAARVVEILETIQTLVSR